jgi:hypothetical protein
MTKWHSRLGAFLMTICCTLWLVQSAIAEIIVIGETVETDTRDGTKFYREGDPIPPPATSGLKVGQRLPDNPMLNIPECVTLTVRAGNRFLTLRGPHKGPLRTYRDANVLCNTSINQSLGERENVYDRYFHEICEKQNSCDTTCKAAFQLIGVKGSTRLKC